MSAALQETRSMTAPQSSNPILLWWPILLGLAALYLPTYYELANDLWNTEEQAHGPIVLAVALFLIWRARSVLFTPFDLQGQAVLVSRPRPVAGWFVLLFGLLLYALGRSQSILLFEIGSQIPVLIGTLLITRGLSAVRAMWFPLFFLIFMVPLPGFVVDAATGPLKQQVSILAENLLYAFGYPIARSGVVLTIGQYQLLVADACSGLHSMFSLSAMGLLYLYLMERTSVTRNIILIASILPISFISNVVRVMILVLVTYYFGDEAGQGFVHGFAGVLLFVVALLILFALDAILGFIFPDRPARATSNKSR
jgi:exosortase B